MSGTASRFQTRFSYAPELRTGNYPLAATQDAPQAAAQPAAPTPQTPAAAPVTTPSAAPAPPRAPVMAGSVADNYGNDGGSSAGDHRGGFDLGPNPGNLDGLFGGGLSGFGVSNYGTLGGALGGLAGLAAGIPGLGMAFGAAGTMQDVSSLNGQLAGMGLRADISPTDALASNASFGMLGQSPTSQFDDRLGFDALAEAPKAAFNPNTPTPAAVTPADIGPQAGPTDIGAFDFGSVNWGGSDPGQSDYGGSFSSSPEGVSDVGSFGGDFGGFGDFGGWMSGGYTGPGHPAEPAGTVHRNEVVIPAHQVARYGLPALMALVDGSAPPSALARLAKG